MYPNSIDFGINNIVCIWVLWGLYIRFGHMELLGNRVFLAEFRPTWACELDGFWTRCMAPEVQSRHSSDTPDLTNSRTCSKTAGCYLSCHFQRTYVCFCVGKHARHVVTPACKHQESRAASSENIACTTRPLRLHRSTCLCLELHTFRQAILADRCLCG